MSEPTPRLDPAIQQAASEAIRKAYTERSGELSFWGTAEFALAAAMPLILKQVADEIELRIGAELHHATDNGHILDRDCQGVAPGERVPAVRSTNVLAALEGFRRSHGLLPVEA